MGLLDRNNNKAILLAGILSIIVAIGVARFVFTSLLPFMLNDFLTITFAGILASINYAGYLSGSIFATLIKDINTKVKYFRIGMVLCLISSFTLGISDNYLIWGISRIVAGFGSALVLVVGSAIVMTKLKMENKTKAMGIHFSGIGFSILVTDLITRVFFLYEKVWNGAWIVLSIFGLVIAIYSVYILSFDKEVKLNVVKHKFDISLFSPFVILLIVAYFTEGIGFVVQATFLPDIINSLEGLEGYGSFTWTLVGFAGIPSCIIFMTLAHKFGSVNIIILAMLIQIVGILVSTFTTNIYLNLFSGVLYGGTFVGLVALFMNLGGKLAGKNPIILMGALTTSYGMGQVIAPLYSVKLVEIYNSYNQSLYLTATIVFLGVLLLFVAKALANENQKMI